MHLIPKKYASSFEQELYAQRQASGCFTPQEKKNAESFAIPIPPPNVTGILHLGHALTIAIEDAMVRYARMQGKRALRIPGTDHASIGTEIVIQKRLEAEKINKFTLGRKKFLERVREWVRQSRATITSQVKRMGASVDRSREEFTMSEQLSRAVRKAFTILYKQEKIYRDTYMVNRSPGAQTVLSDLEVEYKDEQVKLYYIKYFVQGKGESLTVATVRPETMFGDVAVAVHPKDRRYKKRIGKNVLIPIVNRPIPIIADESVSVEFGTGVLKITPSHAEEDFIIAKKHELPLECYALDQQNRYTIQAGEELAGKDAYEFMDNLIQYLDEIGNLEQVVDYETKVPYCERTGVRVQPLLSKQRFFNVGEAASQVKEHLEQQAVAVYPERFIKQFHNRLDQIRPRCISRQLRRGHRIPVRYDTQGESHVFDEDSAVTTQKGKKSIISQIIFNLIADSRLSNPFGLEELIDLLLQPSLTPQRGLLYEVYTAIYRQKYGGKATLLKEVEEFAAAFATIQKDAKAITKQGGLVVDLLDKAVQISPQRNKYRFVYQIEGKEVALTQDEDVLDTRFSSGLRPFSVLGRPEQTPDLARYYPNTVLETGYDIIFFRVIKMMIMGVSLIGKMPFKNVYFHGLVRDERGQKMSKSKGNGVDPLEMITTYGSDSLRGALLSGTTPGNDQKFSEQKVEYMRKFINKLWNATRFVQGMLELDNEKERSYTDIQTMIQKNQKQLNDYDKRIINRLNEVSGLTSKYYNKFMLGEGMQEVIQFIRHDFCDRYVEIVKNEKSDLTPTVLLYVLGTSYKLLHPSLPFVTEKLRQLLGFDEMLMVSSWPTEITLDQKNYRFNLLMDMISQRRILKQDLKQKPHEAVTLLVQGNKDIHLLIQEHELLIKKLLHADEVRFLADTEEIPSGFQVSLLMDIKLGIQGVTTKDRKTNLSELEKTIHEEEQFLQRLRLTISSNDFLGKAPPEVVQEKKQKIEEVKSKIVGLQHEVNRLKMQHK